MPDGSHPFREVHFTVRPIEDILILPEREPWPLLLRKSGKAGGVFLEIGFGNGEYLVHLAGKRPGETFWGAEMSRACVLRAMKRVQQAGLDNVFLLCGDARFFLAECFEQGALDGIYMNFPCPWPKRRHSKRRVSAGGFADELARNLKPGGFFELVTDEEWYGREVELALSDHPALVKERWAVNPPRSATTKYERRWKALGKDIYLFRTIRRGWCPDCEPPTPKEEEPMHEVVPRGDSAADALRALYGQGGGSGETIWIYKKTFSSGDGLHLIEVVTSDDGFEQKFFLQVVERASNCLVKIPPHSAPFLTKSVKGALRALADHLKSGASSGGDGAVEPPA